MDMRFKDIPVPEELDRVVEENMKKIYAQKKRRRIKRMATGFGTVAAVFIFGIFFIMSNPAVAAKFPVIGHIFEMLQNENDFSGDFTGVSQSLAEQEKVSGGERGEAKQEEQTEEDSAATDFAFSQTANGITVTLSEVYCNEQALYISLEMKTQGTMPLQGKYQQIETVEKYSFNPEKQNSMPIIEGKRLDEHTYVGVLRFDLNEKTTAGLLDEEAAMEKAGEMGLGEGMVYIDADTPMKTVEIPDTFTLQLKIKKIFLEDGRPIASCKGPWKFTLDVAKNTEDTQTIELNDINEQGIGLEKVVKDRFEMTIYDIYEKGNSAADYFPVVLDADGGLMPDAYGNVNTVPVQDRDVSRVDIYLVDYIKWMDELGLKGEEWENPDMWTEDGRTLKEVLDEEAAYHKEVKFE